MQRGERIAGHEEVKAAESELALFLENLKLLREAAPASMAFDDLLGETRTTFRQFRLEFLGGPYQAWMKELVNPDELQLEIWKDTWLSAKSPLLDVGEGTLSIVARTLFGSVIMIATLFFIYADGPRILDTLISFSPLEERYVRELIAEFDRVSRAVVLATILSAIAQGFLAGVGYQFAGVGSVFLLMLLTGMFAMVPFLGAAGIWVPVCLWIYFYEGRSSAAIGLAVYGTLAISTADNFIKPMVLHGQSNLHPLLALLSILGGVQTLGPIGILVGPMSVVFLQTLVKIVHREYKAFEHREEPLPPTEAL
jgi:predicted PurR-regulated permease PerM